MMLTGRGDGGNHIFCPSAKWAKGEEGENANTDYLDSDLIQLSQGNIALYEPNSNSAE